MAFGDVNSTCSTPQHFSDSGNEDYANKKTITQVTRTIATTQATTQATIVPRKENIIGDDGKVNGITHGDANSYLIDTQYENQSDQTSGASRRGRMARSKSSQIPDSIITKRDMKRKVIPGIGWYNDDWEEFKYRMTLKEVYTIAVLNGEPAHIKRFENEQRKESAAFVKRRQRGTSDALSPTAHRHSLTTCDIESNDAHILEGTSAKSKSEVYKTLPERIRINSPHVNAILKKLSEQWDHEPMTDEPMIHLRPYKILVVFESKIRKFYAKWKKELNSSGTGGADSVTEYETDRNGAPGTTQKGVTGTTHRANSAARQFRAAEPKAVAPEQAQGVKRLHDAKLNWNDVKDMMHGKEALQHLEQLIIFMDKVLKPHMDRVRSTEHTEVTFHDLWYLFQPGDLLWRPSRPSMARDSVLGKNRTDWQAFRVRHVTGGRHYQKSASKAHAVDDPEIVTAVSPFVIDCFFLDYNGRAYGPVSEQFKIEDFKGYREIETLPIYPLQFSTKAKEIRETRIRNGIKFQELNDTAGHSTEWYSGWTLSASPNAPTFKGEEAKNHIEEVDSQVILDTKQTFLYNPDWIPNLSLWELQKANEAETREMDPQSGCDSLSNCCANRNELIVADDFADLKATSRFAKPFPYLVQPLDAKDPGTCHGHEMDDDELILLPNRIFGFVLRTRRWACLDMDRLKPVQRDKDGFKGLKLPKGHKKMVEALVQMHFRRKAYRLNQAEDDTSFDLISGKGNGLVILLHGAPGVGKTSTAECVADINDKPLFPITCGDLGITPERVERELEEKFRLAQQWDCILLLDEADVFLGERTRNDLQRNSLVSVFLRVLEYYSGILFLTTNRVGALDEAFKSRIHLPLYYPPLDRISTLKIWDMNLDRTLGPGSKVRGDKKKIMKFAADHFDRNETARWNGRQIRNAFQTATALAEYEAQQRKQQDDTTDATPSFPPTGTFKLKVHHFETVEAASSVFENYINDVAGTTAADRTYKKGNRNDNFEDGTQAKEYNSKKHEPPKYPVFLDDDSDSNGESDAGSSATTTHDILSDTSKVSHRRGTQQLDDSDDPHPRRRSHKASISKHEQKKKDGKGRGSREKGFEGDSDAVSPTTKSKKRHTKTPVRHESSEEESSD